MRVRPALRRMLKGEDGATLVELGVVVPVFLLLSLGIVDFGRLAFSVVMAEKAVQMSARLAIVRPPACPGVPAANTRAPGAVGTPRFGVACNSGGGGVCADFGTISCAGSAANPTASEIFAKIRPLLPASARIEHLRFAYAFDEDLGFLGGPTVPMVTVGIDSTPDGAEPLRFLVLGVFSWAGDALGPGFPEVSVSMPAEDLALGAGQ